MTETRNKACWHWERICQRSHAAAPASPVAQGGRHLRTRNGRQHGDASLLDARRNHVAGYEAGARHRLKIRTGGSPRLQVPPCGREVRPSAIRAAAFGMWPVGATCSACRPERRRQRPFKEKAKKPLRRRCPPAAVRVPPPSPEARETPRFLPLPRRGLPPARACTPRIPRGASRDPSPR